jgi:hypothetical protein
VALQCNSDGNVPKIQLDEFQAVLHNVDRPDRAPSIHHLARCSHAIRQSRALFWPLRRSTNKYCNSSLPPCRGFIPPPMPVLSTLRLAAGSRWQAPQRR